MERLIENECWQCKHAEEIQGLYGFIKCDNPDLGMKGNPSGIETGGFSYPFKFRPVWKEVLCNNFEKKEIKMPQVQQQ